MQQSSRSPDHCANYPLPEQELRLVKQPIEERQARSAKPTEDAKDPLAVMEAERAAHFHFVGEHIMVPAPIRRVPQDVLSTIFLRCQDLTEEPQFTLYTPPAPKGVSVILSHVSQEWRRVALDTPALWSRIQIDIPGFEADLDLENEYKLWCRRVERTRYKICIWAQRSSRHAIQLELKNSPNTSFVFQSQYWESAREEHRALIETIGRLSSRWKGVYLAVWFDQITESLIDLFDRPPQEFPILKTFRVCIGHARYDLAGMDGAYLQRITSSGLFAAPSLRSVTVLGPWGDIHRAARESNMPIWETITRFSFRLNGSRSIFGSHQALQTLNALSGLFECDMELANEPRPIPARPNPISLPHLTKLTLYKFPPAIGFASSLRLPSLRRLSLHLHGLTEKHGDHDIGGVTALLEHFGDQLEEFTLYHEFIKSDCLRQYFQHLPNIRKLRLSCIPKRPSASGEEDVFALPLLMDPDVCPWLEYLEIYIQHFADLIPVEFALVDLLERRRGSIWSAGTEDSPLRGARFLFQAQTPTLDIEQELLDRGVDMEDFDLAIVHPGSPRM